MKRLFVKVLRRTNHVQVDVVRISKQSAVRCCLAFMVALSLAGSPAGAVESTEESLAAYADAANFQTNGATELAIDAWNKFLKKYPDDDMASKAAHYLGVCHMQKETSMENLLA